MSLGSRPFSDEEIKKMITNGYDRNFKFYHRNILLFVLQLTTGFRIKEVLSLKVQNIFNVKTNEPRKEIHISKANMKAQKRGRCVVVPDVLAGYIKRYIENRYENIPINPSDWVFFSQKEGPLKNRQALQILKDALARAGIEDEGNGRLGTHSMRKTFCQKFAKAVDNNIFRLFEIMGHMNINSTTHYMKTMQDENMAVAKGMFNTLDDVLVQEEEIDLR